MPSIIFPPPGLSAFPTKSPKGASGIPPPKWALEDTIGDGVNTYHPFKDTPEPIICNMQHPWRFTLTNSAATSWNYRDSGKTPSSQLPLCNPSFAGGSGHGAYQAFTEKVSKVPAWYKHFHIAVRSNQFDDHLSRAKLLVKSEEKWTQKEINQLAYAFIGRACKFVDDDGCAVASFAQQVCYHFENVKPSVYQQFHSAFVRMLIGTFLACWDQTCAWSMARNLPVGCEQNTYVTASLKLATFIGAAMRYGVLSPSDVHPTIRLLLSQARYIEYVEAIHNILSEAGDVFWKGSFNREQDVDAFILRVDQDLDGVVQEPRSLRPAKSGRCSVNVQWLCVSILELVELHGRSHDC